MKDEQLVSGALFGSWLLLEEADPIPTGVGNKKQRAWHCECQCDKKTRRVVRQRSKTALASSSCGCNRDAIKQTNSARCPPLFSQGDVVGRLTIVKLVPSTKQGRHWECLCECGNTKVIAQSTLRSGLTKSCGCIRNEALAKRNAEARTVPKAKPGDVYSRLTVVSILSDEVDPPVLCKCSCGNAITLSESTIIYKKTHSCGCLRNERVRAAVGTHGQSNTKDYKIKYDRQRYAREKQASPSWQVHPTAAYNKFVSAASALTAATGTKHAADHIVPLAGKEKRLQVVCGLHCKDNFQVLSYKDNAEKSNQHWPDKPEYSEADLKELKKLRKKTCYNKR